MKVLDYGYCELVERWGSDESVVEAARMSTQKGFQGWGPLHDTPELCRLHPDFCTCNLKQGDEKLLRYLYIHKHMTPFEMAGFSVEMQLPIFVARELIRHRTFSFNELSARYTALPDLYYIPSIERLMAGRQSSSNKQGSAAGFTETEALSLMGYFRSATDESRKDYEDLLEKGVSRELARLVIPVNQYSKWRMQGTLRNWLDLLRLRLPENVQWETREYAMAVAGIVEEKFPRTWGLFLEGQRHGD